MYHAIKKAALLVTFRRWPPPFLQHIIRTPFDHNNNNTFERARVWPLSFFFLSEKFPSQSFFADFFLVTHLHAILVLNVRLECTFYTDGFSNEGWRRRKKNQRNAPKGGVSYAKEREMMIGGRENLGKTNPSTPTFQYSSARPKRGKKTTKN